MPLETRAPEEDERSVVRGAEFTPKAVRKAIAPLFEHWVIMLAIQHRRAPLPVSSLLWKKILRRGYPNNLDELAKLARRYLLMGDTRMLLADLRARPKIHAQAAGAFMHHQAGLRNIPGAESGDKCTHN